jgi:predicted PhzF superfamily epimerase YddE/YHI9
MRPEHQARFFSENEIMVRRWQEVLSADRFYHRAFSRLSGMFSDLATASVAECSADSLVRDDPVEPQ